MNNFGSLYTYELKKICKRRLVCVTLGIMMLMLVLMYLVGPLTETWTMFDGEKDIQMKGYEYAVYEKEKAQKLAGLKIDDALLEEVKEAYSGVYKEHLDDSLSVNMLVSEATDEEQKDFIQKRLQYDQIYLFVSCVTGNYNSVHNMTEDALYQIRENQYQERETGLRLSKQEKAYWAEQDSMIEKPFTYGYVGGWDKILDEMMMLNFMLILTIGICLANVFSEEHSRKTDQLILCSKHGKNVLQYAKLAAGATFGLGCGIIFLGFMVICALGIYGADGFDVAFQIAFPNCARNMTIGQMVLIRSAIFLASSILYSVIVMSLSEILKNGVVVMGIMLGAVYFTLLFNVPYEHRAFSQLYNLIPIRLLSGENAADYRLTQIGNLFFTNYQSGLILYLFISLVLIMIVNRCYKRYQVSGR
ncbi:MAG: hypothetical protein E7290_13750 [Lachnospiraceae bacterium]|nr:hypothetical protein [Lachnospiraceae bacterium]